VNAGICHPILGAHLRPTFPGLDLLPNEIWCGLKYERNTDQRHLNKPKTVFKRIKRCSPKKDRQAQPISRQYRRQNCRFLAADVFFVCVTGIPAAVLTPVHVL